MDERELCAYHQAAQPILQRTAPASTQSRVSITPTVLDQIAWGVVLAYVANVSQRPPPVIPGQAQRGEGPLPEEVVWSALSGLRRADVQPRLAPAARGMQRFGAAARRLLEANGWAPGRAAQAASELAEALRAATGTGR
jgi:hypothetical protein